MKTYTQIAFSPFVNRGWLTLLILGVGIAGITGLIRTQSALAAEKPKTASEYCDVYTPNSTKNTYTDNTQKNACKNGINGSDCQNYLDAGFSRDIYDICDQAVKDLDAGKVTAGQVSVPPAPTQGSNTGGSSATNPNKLQEALDQTENLSEYVDVLHENGKDKDADMEKETSNSPDYYINGAGKKQNIKVIQSGKGSSPAILFFNGGGWLANDGTSDHVASGKDGGEKATERGYALLDVTYRYGTSGVYYQFEDVMRGIKHVRENADLYGIDPNKIAIWGDSAGGSLSMRAAASGKSGAKVAVGWSAPTNAYTAVFHSFQSFGIGVAHSTCAPTDLAGFANFADLANGGSGEVAEYGQGINSNDFFSILNPGQGAGGLDPISFMQQALVAGRNANSAMQDAESISDQIKSGNTGALAGSAVNIASKKFGECLDNFNVLSPALFASPETPPSFLAGYDNDGVVGPEQLTGMRDKLRQLGIRSEALILPGVGDCLQSPTAMGPAGSGGCHLGYHKDFTCRTLNFVDSVLQPEKGETNCGSGVPENVANPEGQAAEAPDIASQGGSSGGSGSGGNSTGNSGGSNGSGSNNTGGNKGYDCSSYVSDGKQNLTKQREACEIGGHAAAKCVAEGGSWANRDGKNWTCSRPGASTNNPVIVAQNTAARKKCESIGYTMVVNGQCVRSGEYRNVSDCSPPRIKLSNGNCQMLEYTAIPR